MSVWLEERKDTKILFYDTDPIFFKSASSRDISPKA